MARAVGTKQRGKKRRKKAPEKEPKRAKKAPKKAPKKRPKPSKVKSKPVKVSRPKTRAKAKPKAKPKRKPPKPPRKSKASGASKARPRVAHHPDTKERLRDSLRRVCALVEGGCKGIRVYGYINGTVDAELRIGAPTKPKLRTRLLEIEEAMQSEVWPVNAWISVGFMGHLDPAQTEAGYARRMGMEIVEIYPQRRNRMGVNFLVARNMSSALYLRQKISEFVIRIHIGDERPKRRYQR